MIETSPIVKDTRKIRCAISDRFDNDVDSYIDYLLSQKKRAIISESKQDETLADYIADHIGVISSSEHIPGGAQMSKGCGKRLTPIIFLVVKDILLLISEQ